MTRFLFFIFLLISAFSGFAQTKSTKDKPGGLKRGYIFGFKVNTPEEALAAFNYALKSEAKESIADAYFTYRNVFFFDSTAKVAAKAKAKLDSISQTYLKQLYAKLPGSWRWIWSGSNWGNSDTPDSCRCEKSITFDKTTIYFLEGNENKSSYAYYVRPAMNERWPIIYVIDIPELKEKWSAGFRTRSWPAVKDGLSINRQYNCVCGCPTEIFERIVHY